MFISLFDYQIDFLLQLISLQKLKVTYVGVELIDLKCGDLRWCLDFRDFDSPAIISLSDAYGKKGIEGGFVLCPSYGRKSKAFQAASGTTNSAIIANLVWLTLKCSISNFVTRLCKCSFSIRVIFIYEVAPG